MKIALLSSLPVPQVFGGMDRFLQGLTEALRQRHPTDLVTIPVDERTEEGVLRGYYDFHHLDLSAYDAIISYKAPAYMANHAVHLLYLCHRMRVFYDLYEHRDAQHERMRRLIHWMDSWALAPQRIPYPLTIGKTVSERLLRWGNIQSEYIHHPTTFKPALPREGEYFLAVGRLHAWKRFDLIIKAMKMSKAQIPLLIVGTGPHEEALRKLAGGDWRIQFVGHVTEAQLREIYSRAIATLFTPCNEDLGMVTFESFLAGKPVITTWDSGEPAYIVQPGATGHIVDSRPEKLAYWIDWMDANREQTAEMGRSCIESMRHVTWERVVDKLLDTLNKTREAQAGHLFAIGSTEERPSDRDKIKLLVTDNQMIDPPVGGGRVRIWELYRHLPEDFVTTYLGTTDHPGPGFRDQWMAPNFREIIIPLTAMHFKAHEVWRRLTRRDATIDVTIPLLLRRCTPRYQRVLERLIPQHDVVIHAHPWMAPFIPAGDFPVVYDSQNCEAAVKTPLLKRTPAGRWLAARVKRTEKEAIDRAQLTLACSPADAEQFRRFYSVAEDRLLAVPNGVDCQRIRPAAPEAKKGIRSRLRLPADRPLAIFTGSNYHPNIEAVDFLIRQWAPQFPGVTLALIGGAAPAWRDDHPEAAVAPNVHIYGMIEDSIMLDLYQAADLGLNPMMHGSGTNIKMLDYMAAGLPIVTTAIGARGLDGKPGVHWEQVSLDDFIPRCRELFESPERCEELARTARELAQAHYDWQMIAARLAEALRELIGQKQSVPVDEPLIAQSAIS